MTKNGMRAFASGMIITCAVIAFFYYFMFNDVKSSSKKVTDKSLTENSVENFLNKKGQVAIDQTTYDKWQAEDRQLQSKGKRSNNKKSKSDTTSSASDHEKNSSSTKSNETTEESGSQPKTATIRVTSGMTSTDIADQLLSDKVIKNSQTLVNYIISHNLENRIQLGPHKISSDMTLPQIVRALVTYHK